MAMCAMYQRIASSFTPTRTILVAYIGRTSVLPNSQIFWGNGSEDRILHERAVTNGSADLNFPLKSAADSYHTGSGKSMLSLVTRYCLHTPGTQNLLHTAGTLGFVAPSQGWHWHHHPHKDTNISTETPLTVHLSIKKM